MTTLKIDTDENIIATIINNKTNKSVGTLSYVENEGEMSEMDLEDGYHFELMPRPVKEKERTTLFIAGESGAGKSYFVREYAKKYRRMFPKNPIYLISYLDKDETLDEYKEIIRLDAMEPVFLEECNKFDLEEEFSKSLVIFDDIDCITNKRCKERIYGLLNKMLRVGRHYNISVCYVGHELYHSNELKSILNESMTITFFPRFLNYKKLKYLLEVYFGLNKEQIAKIRAIKDRSITYIKGADKLILSDRSCFVL